MYSTGAYFPWSNRHENGERIYSRIDRVLHNVSWLLHFELALVEYMAESISDHCPIRPKFGTEPQARRQFRLCDMWFQDSTFEDT